MSKLEKIQKMDQQKEASLPIQKADYGTVANFNLLMNKKSAEISTQS